MTKGKLITARVPTAWLDTWWGVPTSDPDRIDEERPTAIWKDARITSVSGSGMHLLVYRNKLDAIDDRNGIPCLLPETDCDLT